MSIKRAITTALNKAFERKWDKITIAVDWHDTICKSTYGGTALNFYKEAIAPLRALSKNDKIVLILFTSSYDESVKEFLDVCIEKYDIYFDYVNENPEVENTEYGDFSKKFYYDILIDDKAGFVPEIDWEEFLYLRF